jgi:peptide/nickel transport system substrate-binding protein
VVFPEILNIAGLQNKPFLAQALEEKKMKRRSFICITAFMLMALLLSACGVLNPASKATIIIGVTDQISSLDPADAYATHDWELIRNTGRTLLRWNPGTSDLVPDLATGMPTISDDGLTYTVKMQAGVQFADGLKLTAPMFATQLNRLLTIGPSCPNDVADALAIPYVESITASDDVTLVFKLKSAIAYFPQLLATAPYTPSHPTTFPTTECVLFPAAPVYGVGPWYISQHTQNEQLVLEPNPYYKGDLKPQSGQIIIRYFSDPQTMALAVQNGEIDIAWRFLGPQLISQLQGVKDLTVGTVAGGAIRYLIINHTMAPMDDPNVVKALASVIDRNEIADTVYAGTVSPLYSQNPPGFLGATEAFDTMYKAPNIDAAKAFLAASGYDENNKCVLDMWYPPEHYGAETGAWMEVLKKQLDATGVFQVNLHAQEWATYVSALTGGESYAIGVLGWFFDYPDPSNYLDPFVYNGGMGTNVALAAEGSTFGNPINDKATQLVDLLSKADTETDLAKRKALYEQAQEVYADMVVTLPLFFQAEHIVYRANIKGATKYGSPVTLNIGGNVEFTYSMLTKS